MSLLKKGSRIGRYNGVGGAGFMFEDSLIEACRLIPDRSHTGVWDAYVSQGDKGRPVPVAIKHFNEKNEMVFEFSRQAHLEVKGFYLVVGVYSKKHKWDSKYRSDKVYKVRIPTSEWLKLMDLGLVNKAEQMKAHLRNPNNKEISKDVWDRTYSQFRAAWKNKGLNVIRPRFRAIRSEGKRTSYRFQCAIRYDSFIEHFIESGNFSVVEVSTESNTNIQNYMDRNNMRVAMNGNKVVSKDTPVGSVDYTRDEWDNIMEQNNEALLRCDEQLEIQRDLEEEAEALSRLNLFEIAGM